MALSFTFVLVTCSLIKSIILRRRPYFNHPEIKCIERAVPSYPVNDVVGQGYSCPSGHATLISSLFGSLIVYLRNKWITVLSIIIILLIGVSRLYLGVHYPTDVLASYVLGFASIAFIYILHQKINKNWIIYLILLLISCTGIFFANTPDIIVD